MLSLHAWLIVLVEWLEIKQGNSRYCFKFPILFVLWLIIFLWTAWRTWFFLLANENALHLVLKKKNKIQMGASGFEDLNFKSFFLMHQQPFLRLPFIFPFLLPTPRRKNRKIRKFTFYNILFKGWRRVKGEKEKGRGGKKTPKTASKKKNSFMVSPYAYNSIFLFMMRSTTDNRLWVSRYAIRFTGIF